jgi:hypothetical protein
VRHSTLLTISKAVLRRESRRQEEASSTAR